MIHCPTPQTVYDWRNVPFWLASAFKAGFINSLGFLLAGEFVSHITGFGSRVGITMGHEDYFFGLELLMIPISFIFGGVVTSMILDKEYARDEIPHYFKVQGFITILIGLAILLGESKLLDAEVQFGQDGYYSVPELTFVAILCFICGLKNSLVAWTTYGKIRVTHLTGLGTDLGLNLIRSLNPNKKSSRFKEPRSVNFIRLLIFFFFSLGAFISAMMFPVFGFRGLTAVFIISLILTVVSVTNYHYHLNKQKEAYRHHPT